MEQGDAGVGIKKNVRQNFHIALYIVKPGSKHQKINLHAVTRRCNEMKFWMLLSGLRWIWYQLGLE